VKRCGSHSVDVDGQGVTLKTIQEPRKQARDFGYSGEDERRKSTAHEERTGLVPSLWVSNEMRTRPEGSTCWSRARCPPRAHNGS
jgi:hypothetical protein